MNKFTFGDVVRVKNDALSPLRQGAKAWVVMVVLPPNRNGSHFDQFPPGVVYSIEYEDGESVDVHEDFLEALEQATPHPPTSS
jgi:hypothetical protein